MTAGNIGQWHKKVGDRVEPGDLLCEIETDKAQMDFEVQEEGYLAKILMPTGMKEAEVGKPLAIFVSKAEDVKSFEGYEVPSTDSVESSVKTASLKEEKEISAPELQSSVSANPLLQPDDNGHIKASPLAKKIASELNVDLEGIASGSGPEGRIIKKDILNASSSPVQKKVARSTPAPSTGRPFVDIPHTQMRRIIANRLSDSKQTIPHYYLRMDIQMDKILELRAKFNSTPALQETFGAFKLSVNDFIIKAASLALLQVPAVNSAWFDDCIREYKTVDVSVAVATPTGLITPIVFDADQKGLVAISNSIKELASRAKINKLKPEEFQGGTFTISNLGMFGVDSFTAIINPPQSCILAVGATQPRFIPDADGAPKAAQIMSVTLSCDHRVVDGATGAQWLAHFKRFLEDPEQMIL